MGILGRGAIPDAANERPRMANYMELWWYYSYVAGSQEAEKYVAAQDAVIRRFIGLRCSAVSYGAVQCSAVRRWKGNGMDLLEALMRLQSRVQHSIGIGIGILAAAVFIL